MVTGYDLDYGGQHAAYTEDPSEIINYVSAHDNETIFDAIQLKVPRSLDMKTRVRMNTLALSTVLLGQGVPFFHAGDEILRSKSLDRNSYNSGDWFNKLDWTYQSNNWGVGLPPQQDNGRNWAVMGPLLADPALKPTPADIEAALNGFVELLTIRKSSTVFRMRTAEDVIGRVKYWNTGANQVPGLLVMELKVTAGENSVGDMMVVINATPELRSFQDPSFATRQFALHPAQRSSADETVKTAKFMGETGQFSVPGWTAAVFESTSTSPVKALDLPRRCSCGTTPDMALGGLLLAAAALLRRLQARTR
jgi:pullulanase/glycogen debranching enzyme